MDFFASKIICNLTSLLVVQDYQSYTLIQIFAATSISSQTVSIRLYTATPAERYQRMALLVCILTFTSTSATPSVF